MTTLTPIGRDLGGRFRRLADIERQKVYYAMKAQAEYTSVLFEKTYATWKHKPVVTITYLGDSKFVVGTADEIYGFVSKGTRPHIIRARNAKVLAFKSAYQAKTRPKVIGSGAGGSSGAGVYAVEVHHPGSEARDFERTIQYESQRTIANNVQRAITQGVHEAGLG